MEITIKAIGTVRNGITRRPESGWEETLSEIVLDSDLAEALDGLEQFSHIIVLYWMSQVSGQVTLKVHPQGRPELPLVGLFASRSPHRPNPIGKTTVRLLQRKGNILKVKGLDALDGTPVIDIKPYLPGYDSVADAEVPPWVTRR